jgi:hypothetical protein
MFPQFVGRWLRLTTKSSKPFLTELAMIPAHEKHVETDSSILRTEPNLSLHPPGSFSGGLFVLSTAQPRLSSSMSRNNLEFT